MSNRKPSTHSTRPAAMVRYRPAHASAMYPPSSAVRYEQPSSTNTALSASRESHASWGLHEALIKEEVEGEHKAIVCNPLQRQHQQHDSGPQLAGGAHPRIHCGAQTWGWQCSGLIRYSSKFWIAVT